mmetsp:Transcript_17969/g.60611  ORF Transcript_17969/g.60611 Transcript_17969/m.60611 type:complete len:211 (+) Transcript_17969:186-818(+)
MRFGASAAMAAKRRGAATSAFEKAQETFEKSVAEKSAMTTSACAATDLYKSGAATPAVENAQAELARSRELNLSRLRCVITAAACSKSGACASSLAMLQQTFVKSRADHRCNTTTGCFLFRASFADLRDDLFGGKYGPGVAKKSSSSEFDKAARHFKMECVVRSIKRFVRMSERMIILFRLNRASKLRAMDMFSSLKSSTRLCTTLSTFL